MNNQVVFMSLFLLIIIFFLIYKVIICYIKNNSLIYKEILKLNNYYFFFEDIPKKIVIKEYESSKKLVLKYDFTTNVCNFINNNQDNLLLIIGDIYHNRKYLKLYDKEFLNLIKKIEGNIIKRYLEKKLCFKIKLKPRIDFLLKVSISYKKYTIYNNYNYDELLVLIKKLKDVKQRKDMKRKFIKRERNKLSAGLRYDILKRDKFKCCSCGSSIDDGVKLHVDHIIPLSCGGKTEFNNLQTLCERCNLGKSNKI